MIPARRGLRSASQAERKAKELQQASQTEPSIEESSGETVLKNMEGKRKFAIGQADRLRTMINDDNKFKAYSKGELTELINRLSDVTSSLDNVNMHLTCEEKLTLAELKENSDLDEEIINLKGKLRDRIDELSKQGKAQTSTQAGQEKVQIEVQHTDAAGNVTNTWGTFDGDYAKWRSFRDRWQVAMHSNGKVQPVTKFQNLKTACTGDAAEALGDWDLTDDNYSKAWDKLKSIYEDDYLQVQAFMKKLHCLPRMKNRSSRTIRNVIDTVQKHINGLKNYIKMDEAQTYAVFTVIDRMDTATYSAWEKHRLTLAQSDDKANNEVAGDGDGAQNVSIGKRIPTWNQLAKFLESEVTIRVHAENRGETMSDRDEPGKANSNQKQFKKQHKKKEHFQATFSKCTLCPQSHQLFKCEVFKAMNLNGRRNHISEYDLCERCLQKSHGGRCSNKRSNDPCPRCGNNKYHNSMICQNKELSVLMAKENGNTNRKRRQQEYQGKRAKKHRVETGNQSGNDKIHSSVLKVGNWSLMKKESNAIQQFSKSTVTNNEGKLEFVVALATLKIRIQTGIDDIHFCRVIADTGATVNCIAWAYVRQHKLRTYRCRKNILGVSGPEVITHKVVAYMRPWFNSDIAIPVEFLILNDLEGIYPFQQIEASKEEIRHLGLADEEFDTPAPIHALLGVEVYTMIVGVDIYKHSQGAMMQSTLFGHIVLGKFSTKQDYFNELPILSICDNVELESDKIVRALNKFWDIEGINKNPHCFTSSETEAVERIYTETYYRESNGRYVVTIPIKPECNGLGHSRNMALRQFWQLEKRLSKKPDLKAKYVQFMREYQALGYLAPAKNSYDAKFAYWLPHHPVEVKFRVVVNASAKTSSGESLNTIQMAGGKLQFDLPLQIMRFGKFQIGIATDISKMFNRIGLHPKQWDLQRLFWRESPDHELKEYVITVVMFGLKSSPYNAVRTLRQCAEDHGKDFPQAARVIETCFYVDGGIFGCDNLEEAKVLCKEVEFVLNQGNFPLKGWASNERKLEEYMDAKSNTALIVGGKDETKVLGLIWLKATDEWSILVKDLDKGKPTKRNILKQIASLYDPNGYIAPVIIKAKILMQDIWRLKNVDWDDVVPNHIKEEWNKIYSNLALLRNFRKKRWLNTRANRQTQIHAFCDASEKAYGIAVFVRVVDEYGNIHTSLISAKSKVAPIKKVKCPKDDKISIPRLELLAAVMLSEQLEVILEACDFKQESVTLWSDSIVVLHWIKKHPSELKAFVANRAKIIQAKTRNYVWKHVGTADNPADLVSRGMDIPKFLKSDFWLEGPKWLKQPVASWPITKFAVSPQANVEIGKECKPKLHTEKVFFIASEKDNTPFINKYNDWDKVVNITAYIQRVARIARKETRYDSRYLYRVERKKAAEVWIKFTQGKWFKKEIQCIKSGEPLPGKSKIAPLRPILDENGILRVGGTIDKANLKYEKRHQYIIPSNSRLSYLLLKYAHGMRLHGGIQQMIHFLRKQFWIPKIRQEARAYIDTCVRCVREAHKMAQQIMAELPEVRIQPAPVFQNVGIDLAGPFNLRVTDKLSMSTRARNLPDVKGWVVVFVCLVTRAVHLEVTEGLSTDDFLASYQNFTSRRGCPGKIYSDNGTNFVGADNELQKAYRTWQADKIQHWANQFGTEWHFITPAAPHEGGIWEAAVKSMKHHFRRVAGPQKYSVSGMRNLVTSIEACLNSRPLCALSDDPEDREALTPGHFLIGRAIRLPAYDHSYQNQSSGRHYFKAIQAQVQSFWQQWSEDYLQALTQLPKWRKEHENIRLGQLVLIKTENLPPTYWAMGRVIGIRKGSDGNVRAVSLKTQAGHLERSIHKLCVLPEDIELQLWQATPQASN